jgi:hypothetical protein
MRRSLLTPSRFSLWPYTLTHQEGEVTESVGPNTGGRTLEPQNLQLWLSLADPILSHPLLFAILSYCDCGAFSEVREG